MVPILHFIVRLRLANIPSHLDKYSVSLALSQLHRCYRGRDPKYGNFCHVISLDSSNLQFKSDLKPLSSIMGSVDFVVSF